MVWVGGFAMRYDALAFLENLFLEPAPGAPESLPPADPDHAIMPGDLPPDWYERWEERAAIMEYDGKMPKEHAEAAALADTLRCMREAGIDARRLRE